MQGVNPILIEFADRLIKESKYDLTIPPHGGLRTAEEQKEIFNSGASKCDGYNKKSYHQTGNALDIVIYSGSVKGMYNSKKLEYIGEIGKQIFYYLENVSANVPVSSWLLEVLKKTSRYETQMISPLFLRFPTEQWFSLFRHF